MGASTSARGEGQGKSRSCSTTSLHGAALARPRSRPNRLLYVTPELTEDVHLSGWGKVTIRVAASKPAANLSVWIVSLPWTDGGHINDNIITRGWADPQNARARWTESEPLEPGEFVRPRASTCSPTTRSFRPAQRIGLMIFSSDRDFTLWPEPGTELEIDLDATSLELPVVGGAAAFAKAIGQGE